MKRVIAIDGPAGSGKSTVARKLAERLNYLYIDTGAMYRAVTYYLWSEQIDFHNRKTLIRALGDMQLDLKATNGQVCVILNGQPVGEEIRSCQVDDLVSEVARLPEVREYLKDEQRRLAQDQPSVMEGRDIGTVILPGADLKIFLTASLEARIDRRWTQLRDRGVSCSRSEIKHNILSRDQIDSTRTVAPLRPARDAQVVDTSALTVEQVLTELIALVQEEDRCTS